MFKIVALYLLKFQLLLIYLQSIPYIHLFFISHENSNYNFTFNVKLIIALTFDFAIIRINLINSQFRSSLIKFENAYNINLFKIQKKIYFNDKKIK
jgi:hypothetical protein